MDKSSKIIYGVLLALVVGLGGLSIHLNNQLASLRSSGKNDPVSLNETVIKNAQQQADFNVVQSAQSLPLIPEYITAESSLDGIRVGFNNYTYGIDIYPPETNQVRIIGYDGEISVDSSSYRVITINGSFAPNTTYKVILGKGWSTSDGRVMETDTELMVTTPDVTPELNFVSSGFYYPAKREKVLLPFKSVMITNLTVSVYKAYENNLLTLGYNRESYWENVHDYDMMEELVTGKSITLEPPYDKHTSRFLDLSSILTNVSPGHYYVSVESEVNKVGVNGKTYLSAIRSKTTFALTDLAVQFTVSPSDYKHAIAYVTSISTGKPVPGARINVVLRNNQFATDGFSDEKGIAILPLSPKFNYDKWNSMITGVLAKYGNDSVYLDFKSDVSSNINAQDARLTKISSYDGMASDLSIPNALVFSERDLCRPGESFESSVFIRASQKDGAKVLANTPITIKCYDSSDKEVGVKKLTTDEFGFTSCKWDVPKTAGIGVWKVTCVVANKEIGRFYQNIATYTPDAVSHELLVSDSAIVGETPLILSGKLNYYYGAPVDSGKIKITAIAKNGNAPKFWNGWTVGTTESLKQKNHTIDAAVSNGVYKVVYEGLTNNFIKSSFSPVKLVINSDFTDVSGKTVSANDAVSFFTQEYYLGIREYNGEKVNSENRSFDVKILPVVENDPSLLSDLSTNSLPVKVRLFRKEWEVRYVSKGGKVEREWFETNKEIKSCAEDLIVDDKAPAEWVGKIKFNSNVLSCGEYFIEAVIGDKAKTIYPFWHWQGKVTERSKSPSALIVKSDKPSFEPGEIASLSFHSMYNGTVHIVAGSDGINAVSSEKVAGGEHTINIPIPANTTAGRYYVALTLVASDTPTPQRLFAMASIKIDNKNKHLLKVDLDLPEKALPGSEIDCLVNLKDAEGNPIAGVVKIDAVDEGVAALSDFHVADIFKHFYGWDYGNPFSIYDFYNAICPELKILPDGTFGGDSVMMSAKSRAVKDSVVKTKSTATINLPPVYIGTNGTEKVRIKLPNHIGAMRFMAVGTSKERAGSMEDTMIVRPPVILSPSAPRFITAGDSFDLIVKISNQDAPDGEWNLEVVLPEGITHNGSSSIKTKGYLKQGEEVIKTFTLGSSSELFKALTAKLTLTIADERIEESVFITTRPITKPTRHVKYYPLTNGIVTIPDPAKDWHDGADVSYEALSSGICGLKEAEKWLSEYDYDCTEQITSKAFPYLIAEDLLKLGVVSEDYKKQDKAKAMMTYADILQRLCNNGEFSMWPRWNQPWGYGTVFADHFIFEAEKRKLIEVDNAIRNALIHILSVYAQDARSEFAFIRAYATYVLAVAGEKSFITPARNIISRQGNDFNSFIAAMALFKGGYALEAMQALEKCKDSLLQSTSLQEVGMGLYMISQTGIQDLSSYVPLLYKIDNTIGDGGTWDTTIGNCWSLLGKGAFLARITNGEPNAKNIVPEITSDAANSSVTISAQTAIYAKVDIVGTPKVSLAHEKPVKVEVEYLDAYGKKVSKVQKGDLITVVVNVATPSIMDNAVLASLVPGGFEIEDSSLLTRSTVSAYKVSNIYNDYGHKEIRDDRFLWFGSLPKSNQNRPFTTFSYYIRAVIPGQYRIPVTGIEKMYDPNFSGETLQSDEVIVIE